MQVDQYLKPVPLRPAESPVQLLHTADKGLPVPKYKVWDRNPHSLHAHGADCRKVTFRDILGAVYPDSGLVHLP